MCLMPHDHFMAGWILYTYILYFGSGTFLYNCPSVFRLTCTVLVDVVGDVVNPNFSIFFSYYVNFDVVNPIFFLTYILTLYKRQILFSYINLDLVNATFSLVHVMIDVINPKLFLLHVMTDIVSCIFCFLWFLRHESWFMIYYARPFLFMSLLQWCFWCWDGSILFKFCIVTLLIPDYSFWFLFVSWN